MAKDGVRDHDRVSEGDHSDHPIQVRGATPGTALFGEQARLRLEAMKARADAGDMRLVTAGRFAKNHSDNVNKILAGD